jgi:hypothetical protein
MAETKPATFEWQVISRAWFSAWQFFESWRRDIGVFVFSFVVGEWLFFRVHGWPDTWKDAMDNLIHIVAPAVAIWILLFVWHLWLAPSALVYEAFRKAYSERRPDIASRLPGPTLPPPINWAPWKVRGEYSLYEFAKILAKTDPAAQAMNTEGSAFIRLLLEEINAGNLEYIPRFDYRTDGVRMTKYELDADYDTCVKREVALAWAATKRFPIDHVR